MTFVSTSFDVFKKQLGKRAAEVPLL